MSTKTSILLLAVLLHSSPAWALWGASNIVMGTTAQGRQVADDTTCVPLRLQGLLKEVAAKFGRVEVMSAYRSRADNAARSGAKGSMHINCRAVDFIYPGYDNRATQQRMADFLKTKAGIRYNVYCSGRTHVDDSRRANGYSTCVN